MIFEVLSRNGAVDIESESFDDDIKGNIAKTSRNRRKPSAEFWQRLARNSRSTPPKRLTNENKVPFVKRVRAKSAKI